MVYPKGFVIYSDPPYANTAEYKAIEKFNSEEFWDFQRQLNKKGCKVFISEYKAPEDFKTVLEIETRIELHSKSPKRIEKLFTL